jgi:hypothetical protein
MKFNKFTWDLYRNSNQGKKTIRRFSGLTSKFIDNEVRTYHFEFFDEFKDQYPSQTVDFDIAKCFQESASKVRIKSWKEAKRHFSSLMRKGVPFEVANNKGNREIVFRFGGDQEDWYDYIGAISLGLHLTHSNFFLPYNFRNKFSQLEEIHAEFGIPLPVVPGKFSKGERALYYLAVNETWLEFRSQHELSPAEMCAFLYDFALQFTTPLGAMDLPSPSKAWVITGGSWDIELADNATEKTVAHWGGNSAVRRGDILVMYLVKPRSCFHSVWRACTDGFIDPFSHYHSNVWICDQIKTPPITYAELQQHPLLSQKPAVRAHFQGPSSKASFLIEEYEAILKILKAKGQNISVLPKISGSDYKPATEVLNERDVELQLIEPFLKRLGYRGSDWIRQMPIKMGCGERNYPDYAFATKTKRGDESARMVLESKYQLSAQKEFAEAFYQTKSYALRLQSIIMAMASKEGIWVFPPENGSFEIKRYIHKNWGDLSHPDRFHNILIHIGRDSVFK